MRDVLHLTQSSVGKKVLMAATGIVLAGFVFVHMLGNLKIYQGPEKYDRYAEFLRTVGAPVFGHGQVLWIARFVLLFCVGVHVYAATDLYLRCRRARSARYRKFDDLSFSRASRTMRWGGVLLVAFVVYHLLHLTFGTAHPDFVAGSAYRNVVAGFKQWPVSAAYVAAMIPLGLHLYHGMWSTTQTLALEGERVKTWRRPLAAALALAIVIGNVSIPVAVLIGVVR
ncbi:MAG TPA: succinate dehydrogenase cytochrome b subunit [Candidatus Polarisedimenticolaceae bacterium]|nr:succinate dehydrogenase cytochrome b subunit [Candidatus Polarisedimenticolaceae bacterium]